MALKLRCLVNILERNRQWAPEARAPAAKLPLRAHLKVRGALSFVRVCMLLNLLGVCGIFVRSNKYTLAWRSGVAPAKYFLPGMVCALCVCHSCRCVCCTLLVCGIVCPTPLIGVYATDILMDLWAHDRLRYVSGPP